jgi:hypothetical protein
MLTLEHARFSAQEPPKQSSGLVPGKEAWGRRPIPRARGG